VCDRFDAKSPDVMFPDDSAYHLIGALPERRVDSWLDVGTGNGIAPLAARGRAHTIRATDLSAPAIERAHLGAALSGIADIELAIADLTEGALAGAPWDLITFNAPIPAEAGAPDTDCAYTVSPAGARLLERFWDAVPELLADDGEVIVHSVCAEAPPPRTGSIAIARYTPHDAEIPFGITSWRPSDPRGTTLAEIVLTPSVPHVHRDHLRP
jgi:methylase of polypeptide subunit release factors